MKVREERKKGDDGKRKTRNEGRLPFDARARPASTAEKKPRPEELDPTVDLFSTTGTQKRSKSSVAAATTVSTTTTTAKATKAKTGASPKRVTAHKRPPLSITNKPTKNGASTASSSKIAPNGRPQVVKMTNKRANHFPTQANKRAKTTGKSSTTIASTDAYIEFSRTLADGKNQTTRDLAVKGKSGAVTIKDLQTKSNTALEKLQKIAAQNMNQRFEEKVVNPMLEYIAGLENALAYALSELAKAKEALVPQMPQPADVDGERCKTLAKQLVPRKNDYFPFRKRLNNDYWDGGKSRGSKSAHAIVFPKIEGEVLTKEEQSEVIQEVMHYRNIRERTIRDTLKKYLTDTQYFMTPVGDESIVGLKERHLNSFFGALVKGKIKRADDELYMAFKEALAPLLVTQFRILEGKVIVRAGGKQTNPTQHSTRKTRIKEMFRHTQTVQSLASKYEVSFVALVIYDHIRKRERSRKSSAGGNKAEGRKEKESQVLKSTHWKDKALAEYARFVECFDALWTTIPDGEDFIYPLIVGTDRDSDSDDDFTLYI
jgi:hypothetical protein